MGGGLVDATGGAHSNREGCDSTTDGMKKTHSLQEEKSIWTLASHYKRRILEA